MTPQQRLANVKEGMAVYDSADNHVGTVKDIYFGTGSDEAEAYTTQNEIGPDGGGGIAPDIAETFGAGHELPDAVQKRLLTHGYVRIDRGFGSDYYVMADQVRGVLDDRVLLGVSKDELVH